MQYDFDTLVERRGSDCVKYDVLDQTFGRSDIIPMWVADMDFRVAPFIRDAVVARANHDVYGYGIRSDRFYNAVRGWLLRRNGWSVERDWIDFTPGVVSGFVFALRSVTAEGDGVVIMPPVYPPFAAQIAANRRRVVESGLVERNGRFEIDFDDLDRKLERSKALLFCNPHNPTGRVFTESELRRVGELCVKHNISVVSDEIHSDLIQKPCRHYHLAALDPRFAERTITFVAPSKTFNIAGLSTSVSIVPDSGLRTAFADELNRYHVDQGNVFGTEALIAAYNGGDEWLDQLNSYVGENMDLVEWFCREQMKVISALHSQGTYMMWLDCRNMELEHDRLIDFFVNKAKVGMNDGATFGSGGEGFMRINLATSHAVVSKALSQIAAAWRREGHL